ncbi:MAG TPA: plasmid pRiA4b ORF-3 family protein [Anaeromyxobacter sp.]|nr:plasmid pRiA4b ORF-3 family protein [Anaeromyxobacter sp.]
MARSRADQILQLKVTLAEVEPLVWRRLLVPADVTLAKLHDVLQDAMGWTNSHLHCFEIAGRRIGMVGVEEDSPELEDERRVQVASVLPKKGARLVYRYDYGDDWEHVVEVEDVTAADRRLSYPLCIAGARACPPEDCGGAGAYEDLLRALARPDDDRHDELLTWVGGYFDPEGFDANAVNRLLRGDA